MTPLFASFALVMSFNAMAAELVLAQTMTVLFGGTIVRYGTVMGIFIFAMGIGAAYWARTRRHASIELLATIEAILALLIAASPPLVVVLEAYGATHFLGAGHWAALIFSALIGLIAGAEIPVLIDLASGSERRGRFIIAADFLGSVVATALVPLALYPTLGIFGSAAAAGLLCALLAVMLLLRQRSGALSSWTISFLAVAATFAMLWHHDSTTEYVAQLVF